LRRDRALLAKLDFFAIPIVEHALMEMRETARHIRNPAAQVT
jgi:hypothetical protein